MQSALHLDRCRDAAQTAASAAVCSKTASYESRCSDNAALSEREAVAGERPSTIELGDDP